MIPPSRVIATIPTVGIKAAGKAQDSTPSHEVLLEKNFTGLLRIKVRGQSSGDRIVITAADAPNPKSVFNQVSEYIGPRLLPRDSSGLRGPIGRTLARPASMAGSGPGVSEKKTCGRAD